MNRVVGENRTNDILQQISLNSRLDSRVITFTVDAGTVLRRNQNCIDTRRLAIAVGHCHLGFAVRAKIRHATIPSRDRELAGQTVGQTNWQRHQLGGFIAGIAKHQALITGTNGIVAITIRLTPPFEGNVNTLGNIRRLFIEGHQHRTTFGSKTTATVGVANFGNFFAGETGVINLGLSRNFAGNHNEARIDNHLNRHTTEWVCC